MILPPPSTAVEHYKIVLNDSPMVIVDIPGTTLKNTRDALIAGLFAVVFVVDWGDELRRCSAIDDLRELCITNDLVRAAPLLVAVNKVEPVGDPNEEGVDGTRSAHGAEATANGILNGPKENGLAAGGPALVSAEAARQSLGLETMSHSYVDVVCCSAAAGRGIQEILLWLNDASSTSKRFKTTAAPTDQPDQVVW